MSDRPIIFSGPMVRTILAGRKTQTRRVLKPQPDYRGGSGYTEDPDDWGWMDDDGQHVAVTEIVPNGFRVGDRLWVREAWRSEAYYDDLSPASFGGEEPLQYKADGSHQTWGYPAMLKIGRSRSPLHMPRWASRLTLIVDDVRVQRVQDISEEDARAEGVRVTWSGDMNEGPSKWADENFADLWNEINAKRGYGWDANPWVVALTFRAIQKNIDEVKTDE